MSFTCNAFLKPSILSSVFSAPQCNTITTISSRLARNHYESLGLPRNATQADIKAAYYKLSLLYHPDRNDSTEAAQSFREITEAYEVIGNFKLRKMYDRGLLGNVNRADHSSQKTYTNYNPTASEYRNKPTYHNRSTTYNFDEWSRFHYGDVFSRRSDAKMKYGEKSSDTSIRRGEARNENVLIAMLTMTFVTFIATYSYRDSLDEPQLPKEN